MPDRPAQHRPGEMCPQCHYVHLTPVGSPACVGHVRYDRESYVKGEPRKLLPVPRGCRKPPIVGLSVCEAHGGSSARGRQAAAQRVAVAKIHADAQALLASVGIDGVNDPLGEMRKLAAEVLALKTAAGARVNALDDIRYTGGLERDEDGGLRGTGTEQLRAEVALLERAQDRSMRVLELLVRHGSTGGADDTKAMLRQLGQALGIE